ncbi:hypothetical protein M2139_001329 [Enterococcus sp. PF1-24]|uniref:hypothetical protein n=1 Tax=unclassified Enterococcus TaxID=2608891 RepID=UPI002473B7BC|nr:MULTISPECIES: hypothetical protein [unclassified Enterococcus]MDH6364366.1 hypothetical protein [Enterococcus sp. PFB1-1]MDH6401445.1 hypothetical protein [Enterococcus sp. PF1-24]
MKKVICVLFLCSLLSGCSSNKVNELSEKNEEQKKIIDRQTVAIEEQNQTILSLEMELELATALPEMEPFEPGESITLTGVVKVGEDIPAGRYDIKIVDGNMTNVYVYKNEQDKEAGEDIDLFSIGNDVNELKGYKLIQGYILENDYPANLQYTKCEN